MSHDFDFDLRYFKTGGWGSCANASNWPHSAWRALRPIAGIGASQPQHARANLLEQPLQKCLRAGILSRSWLKSHLLTPAGILWHGTQLCAKCRITPHGGRVLTAVVIRSEPHSIPDEWKRLHACGGRECDHNKKCATIIGTRGVAGVE